VLKLGPVDQYVKKGNLMIKKGWKPFSVGKGGKNGVILWEKCTRS